MVKAVTSLWGCRILGDCLLWHVETDVSAYALSVHEKQRAERGGLMENQVESDIGDDLRPEYDLSQLKGPVRGKYAQRCHAGTDLVLLAPDVAQAFPNDEAVNEALRLLIRIARAHLKEEVHVWDHPRIGAPRMTGIVGILQLDGAPMACYNMPAGCRCFTRRDSLWGICRLCV